MGFMQRLFRRLPISKAMREWIIEQESVVAKHWVMSAHRRLMAVQWGLPPQPEHFDHHIDLFYQWLTTRNPMWLERGVFGSLALHGGVLLELACGDGFNARNFYSLRSANVIACDFDPKAIETARRKNNALNVLFVLADIRTAMPAGTFDNVIWDAAIEHFTPEEITAILHNLKQRLTKSGILSGYTIVERSDGAKSLSHHEYEFCSKEHLMTLLSPYFNNVTVFETIYPDRHNLYFWASDGAVPFSPEWDSAIVKRSDGFEPRRDEA